MRVSLVREARRLTGQPEATGLRPWLHSRRGKASGADRAFPSYLEVTTERAASVVVHVRGELDLAGGPPLERLLADMDSTVVVELSGLTFVDSSGVGSLVRSAQTIRGRGHDLLLRGPLHPPVARTLRMLGLPVPPHGSDVPLLDDGVEREPTGT